MKEEWKIVNNSRKLRTKVAHYYNRVFDSCHFMLYLWLDDKFGCGTTFLNFLCGMGKRAKFYIQIGIGSGVNGIVIDLMSQTVIIRAVDIWQDRADDRLHIIGRGSALVLLDDKTGGRRILRSLQMYAQVGISRIKDIF